MTRKTRWRKFGSKGIVLLSLLLLIGLAGGAFAQTEQPLENYATSIQAELKANAQGEDLPQYVENGQSLFFGLQISDFKSRELVTYLKANPEADFTIPLDFTGHIEGNYPTKINPDDFDNVAYAGGEPLFRWWIDEDSDVIRVRFDENWIHNASNNTVVENVKLGFDGTLNVADKGVDGKLVFKAANDSFPLQMKTGYAITKEAGKPVYRDGQYVVDFTVKFTLDQKMNIAGTAAYDGYAALLTLDDTLNANSAMTGEIVVGPSITGANGLTVTAAKNGTANTFSFGGVTELNKGTYTIQFTMKLDGNAAAAKLEGYDKQNTVELKENNASLAKPVKADVSIAWDANVSNQFKVDKAILPQSSTTNVYIDGKDYYVDYIVAVYLKNEFTYFTVVDQIVSNAAHSDRAPTLLGVNTAEGFWNSTAKNIPDNLTQMRADVVYSISGSNRTITVTAPAGDMLPAGAYYLKVPVKVTDSVKTLAETANKNISANQTQNVTVVYKNKAVLDDVDGNTDINEVSPEVTDTLRAPANFIKRGAIETDSSGNHTIYEKEGLRGKLIRWDVEFSWTIPDQYTVLTDTMKGGQVLLANGSTSIDIWDMSSGKPVEITKLWNKKDRDFISFGTDANDNETFTFYPGRLSDDPALSTRKFKLTYYTLVPEDTVDFTGMKNNWNISYPNPDTGVSIGPVPGEETPIMGDTVKLTMSKVAKDTAYDVHDMYLRWTVTINNSNKIPMSALGDLKLTEDVDLTKKDGVLKDVDFDVWFDPTSRAPELVMYYGASSTITLERGVHYSVSVSADDDSIMVIDFDEAAMAASLAEVGADRFNKIIMTVYTFNTDYNNVGDHTNSTYPRAHIKNTAKLDYATGGMKQDTIESSSTRGREFTTGMKRTAPLNGEWFADYDNDGEKELRWQLEIGSGSFPKMNAIIKAVDTLPEGQKLKYEGSEWKKNFKVYLKSTSGAIMDVPLADDAFSINGDTFELTVNKTQNVNNYYNIFIEYYTVFEDGALQDALEKAGADANDITVPLNNQATLYLDGILLQETDITPDLTINNLAVDKSAKFLQSSGSKVNYTIEMNPYKLDLVSGSDVVRLIDNMGKGEDVFAYIPSSFKVTNLDTGAQLSPASAASSTTYVLKMVEDGKSFTLDVPDNTPLKLTYQVKTTQPVGTKVTLLNNASLAGRNPKQESITFNVSSAYQSGSFSVLPYEAGIRLMKISSEGADSDAPTFLSGAEFAVTQLDAAFQQVGTVQTMTTDAKGLIEIKQTITDVVYLVIEETKAPAGYRLGAEPWKWCYALVPAVKSLSDEDMAKLKETVHCDVTVIPAGSYVEDSIINEPITLTVRKVDQVGNLLDGARFTLKKGGAAIPPDNSYNVAGELLFKNLTQGTYTLEETAAPEGYTVPEECPWSFTLDANGAVKLNKEYDYLSISEDGLCLIVVNKPETASVTVAKSWNDANDQDGKRKDVVANAILSKTVDGTTTDIETVVVGTADDWSHKWENLPVYKDGNKITYSVREELVTANGYTSDTLKAVEVTNGGSVTITNTYSPETTSISVSKKWEDKNDQDGKRKDVVANAILSKTVDGTTTDIEPVAVGKEDNWSHKWENLPVYKDGNKITYSVREELVTANGYTSDTLKAVEVTNGGSVTITNTYSPETTSISVVKEWDDQSNRENKRPDSVSVQLYADGSVLGEPVTLNEANQWTHIWSGLDKYAAGAEIDYTVDETGVPDGYVKSVNGNSKDGFTVKNTYVFGVTAQIKANKTLTGRDLEANQFAFILKDASGNTLQGVGHDKDGNVLFDALVYEQANEYTYTVEEKNDGKAGYIYDKKVYDVTVKVTQNEDDHQLKAEVSYTLDGKAVEAITFENAYNAQGSVQFRGVKTLMDGEVEEGQFSFQLQDAEGKEIETVRNDAKALFTFSEITYDETMLGDHTYTLIEVDEGRPGYVYDDIEYEIIVTVSDAGDGTLDVTYTANGDENGALLFENEYVAEGKVQFVGKKTLTGRDLAEGQFSFTLTGEEVNETVTNDKDGKFVFAEITYDETKLGDHTYTVTEVNGGQPGYTYDETEYEIIVIVADNGDGTLDVSYTVNGEENGAITFKNEYKAEGSVQFEGVKTLTGRTLEEGQFSFTLTGENVNETVTNDKDGKFVFAEITYDETMLGDHTYTVTEVNDGKAGYTYSEAEYEIVVTVADKGDGTLDVSYTVNGETDTEIAFENVYEAEGKVQFKGSKTLTGRDLEEGQFSFTLTGEMMGQTVENDKDGKFSFDEIIFDQMMLGEYTFTVTEENDEKPGYTYDDTEYEIIVNVADNGDGTLDVTYTVNGEEDAEILFANEYAADATVTISGEKTVGGEKPEADEIFSFQLKDADGKVLQEVENTGSSITFDEIPYTLADAGKIYTYTIQESTESNEQYLTDGSVYTVQVALTDKGDGTLNIDWTLEKDGEEAEKIAFDNTPLSRLDIEKTVIGRAGDQEKLFAFKVTLTDEEGKELKGTFPVEGANVTSIESGSYLHLKHGEKAIVKCLPVGTKYVVEEDEYTAFETEAKNAEGEITEEGSKAEFVNTLKTVSFSVTKEWQGGDNGLITLTLYENGKKMEPQPTYAEENNVYTYMNLPQYTEEGKAIVYAAKEKYMDGYMTIYRNIAPYAQETDMIYNGGTIVNKAVTSFHVKKVWEGLAEDEEAPAITLTLYCNGEALDKKTPAPNEDGWYIWHNLPLTYKGEAAEYTVAEEPVEGFTVSYGEAAEGEEEPTCARDYGTIVNRKIPRTGDDSNIGLWIGLSALSACGFILLMKKRKEA